MTQPDRDPAIRGQTIRFKWTHGPTKGTTYEHVFHEDGTVEWHDAGPSKPASPGAPPHAPERPAYAASQVAEGAYVVSYLAPSGYTLTVVLNFSNRQLIGFASSAKEWFPVRGTFEVVR
jgi:MoaF N-terminal domain